jgi:adenylyl cyclase-associated protein
MEAKDTLNRSKEGREWGACLSVVGEGVSAWGWVQVVRTLDLRLVVMGT